MRTSNQNRSRLHAQEEAGLRRKVPPHGDVRRQNRHGQLPLRAGECVRGGRIQVGASPSPGPGSPASLSPRLLRAFPTLRLASTRFRAGEKGKGMVGRAWLTSRRTARLGGRVAPPLTSCTGRFGVLGPHRVRLGLAWAPYFPRIPLGPQAGSSTPTERLEHWFCRYLLGS